MKWLLTVVAVLAALVVVPSAVRAQSIAATCWSPGTASTLYNPPANQLTAPLCNASGQLSITGSFSTVFPYTFTASQTATSASFVGIASYDGAHIQPVSMDTSGHLQIICTSGCGSTVFPYNVSIGSQVGVANSFLGAAGYDGTHVEPLLTDATGRVIVSCTSGCAATTFPYDYHVGTQSGAASSFLGAAGYDGTHVEPILVDTTGREVVSCTSGCSSSLPYAMTNGQSTVASSALGVGGLNASSKFSPLQLDASNNLLVDVTNTPAQTAASGGLGSVIEDPTTAGRYATVTAGGALDVAIVSGATAQTLCNKTAFSGAETSNTTAVLAVAAVGGQVVDICTVEVVGAGTNTAGKLTLLYGTQTTNPCDTGSANIIAAFNLGSMTGGNTSYMGSNSNTNAWYTTPAAQQVCIVGASGTVNAAVLIHYGQHV